MGQGNKESSFINLKLWDIQVNCNNKWRNNELFLAAFPYCEKQLSTSSYLSVRPHETVHLPLGRFFLWNLLNIFRKFVRKIRDPFNPLNAELNPICQMLALLGAHHIFHVSSLRVKSDQNNEYFTWRPVLLTVHISVFISVINQLDAQNFCFTISLFHASTCFEHMCLSSGGQNCITQTLVSSHL